MLKSFKQIYSQKDIELKNKCVYGNDRDNPLHSVDEACERRKENK